MIQRANLDRAFGYQIFDGRKSPSRDKVIQLAFGFGLNYEETSALLLRNKKSDERAVLKLLQSQRPDLILPAKLENLEHVGLPRVLKVCVEHDQLCILREYIEGETLAETRRRFSPEDRYAAAGNWYASGTKVHGPITQLTDIKLLPNLRYVMIAANLITDISPLSDLPNLEKVEFKHNSISDITSLKGMIHLVYVGLNDNPMTDVSVLVTLPNLRYLDLCDASNYAPAGLGGLGDMEQLNISNRTDSWRHLGVKQVRDLRLGWTSIDSLEYLSGITGLEHLEIEHTSITSLEGIEVHAGLTYLRLSGCAMTDLSPLLELPDLQIVAVDEKMKPMIEAMNNRSFAVQYEQ